MSVLTAFTEYQRDIVNADIAQINLARSRRDAFLGAFGAEPDVVEAFCSGSLRRGTQLRPIHDVDIVVVYSGVDHPDWGEEGDSSEEAMRHAQGRVTALLGAASGTYEQLVRRTRVSGRGRSVKCFIDTIDTSKDDAFTVDVMPVLRTADGTLLLPSQIDRKWTEADPEYLIDQIRQRQEAWSRFRPTVRLLKLWARERTYVQVKSLTTEILALHHLPTDAGNVPEALRRFFIAAADAVSEGVEDPAGFCGPTQKDLDHAALREYLELAADHAEKAVAAQSLNDLDAAIAHWQSVLGPQFAPRHIPSALGTAAGVPVARPVRDAPQG